MPRPTRLDLWTLIAVLAAAMVYAVRSVVAPAFPPPRLSKPAEPTAVTVVFLPAPVQAAAPAPPVSASQRQPPEPARIAEAVVPPRQPRVTGPEPLPEPPVPLRPAAAPAPVSGPAVAPLVPGNAAKAASLPQALRVAAPSPLPGEPQVAPMMPGKPADARSATAAPMPLRPRPLSPRQEAAPDPDAAVSVAAAVSVPDVSEGAASAAPKAGAPRASIPDADPRTDELAAGEGRALLRILEHGSGPTIDIAWPAASGERERLYHRLKSCFGMRSALMDAGGRLYAADGRPGEPWAINLDRHSGFVRQARGQVTADERRDVGAIAARHTGLADAAPVRVFPRTVDALLLGHLRHAVGEGYAQARVIRAAYRLSGDSVAVESIEVDGRRVDGRIDLAAAATRGCRGGMTS